MYSTVLLFCVDLRWCYMGQLDKSYSNKVSLRVLLISCCINTLCNFFTILFENILCQLQIMFTMTRQTTSSAHVVWCNIPKDVHVPSLRKQLTFYDATTGFPAKWHLRNDCRNSILWWQVTTQIWVVRLIGCAVREFCFNQSKTLPRSGKVTSSMI